MISVLIPVYNYCTVPLVTELSRQLSATEIEFEILIGDDSDDSECMLENAKINTIPKVNMQQNQPPFGRSKNRNDLASRARYSYLLFIDGDAAMQSATYITTYLEEIRLESDVVCGGTLYQKKPPPDKKKTLRWKYGRSREMRSASIRKIDPYRSFTTFQFIIRKELFDRIRFDTAIGSYGHEDTLFGLNIMKLGADIKHIDNGLYHEGLESSERFLEKTRMAVECLHELYISGKIEPENYSFIQLLNQWVRLKRSGLNPFLSLLFRLFSPILDKHLQSSHPSLLIMDLYKLGYLSTIG